MPAQSSTQAASADVKRIAVLGASGYTGEEVVRLLAQHPQFKVTALTGESQAGKVRKQFLLHSTDAHLQMSFSPLQCMLSLSSSNASVREA